MSIKLLQINPSYKPAFVYGGPTMSVAKLCEALIDCKIDLTVLTTTANGKEELPVIAGEPLLVDGVPVIYFNRITKDHTHFSPALLRYLKRVLSASKSSKPKGEIVVHIHSWWNLVAILSCQIAKWFRIPVILSPRGMLTRYSLGNRNSGPKAIIHRLMGKKLLEYCHIHATSEKEKDDVLQFINPKSIRVIPNLVNLPKEKLVSRPEVTEEFQLLFLSRVEEKKGLELLFEALKDLNIKWKLTIAGKGDNQYVTGLQNQCVKLGIAAHVEWLGHVHNDKKFELMASKDITVLTSHNENFANMVIESLSVGTPVLLSDQVGLSDYVAENGLGWITSLEKEEITATIETAFHAINKRNKIREIAPHQIEADFQSNNLVHQYILLYQHALNV